MWLFIVIVTDGVYCSENPGVFAGVKQQTGPKTKDQKKLKPNEPCHCGSKSKYKVSSVRVLMR